jgi:hypothetical protein
VSRSIRGLPEHTDILKKNLFPFLFMGCWNYTSKGPRGSKARDAVLSALQYEKDTPMLVVAGDNAYPDKNKAAKTHTFHLDEIGQGFSGLKATDKRLLVGIGNHNAERLNAGDRRILQVEEETFGSALPNPYFCRLFSSGEKYALLFLDTNAFEEEKIEELNERYDEEYLDTMLEWLERTIIYLKRKGYKYYLVQHEPLFGIKQKKGGLIPVQVNRSRDILDILRLHRHYPVAVLSAHIHNHQEWDLNYKGHKIRQVIAGTGGAKPDYVPELETMALDTPFPLKGTPFRSIYYKTALGNRTPSYGYLRIGAPTKHDFHAITADGINFRTDK